MKGYGMKKIIGVGLTTAMMFSLVGCSNGEPSGNLMADYHSTDLSGGGEILYEDGKFHVGTPAEEIYQKANEIIGRMKEM